MFAAFVPFAALGNWLAWRFVKARPADNPDSG
jgi:hypothetical protein